jgi:hypothetical protein
LPSRAYKTIPAFLYRELDYLKAENQVLKNQLTKSGKRMNLTDEQRRFLAVKTRLAEVGPETILHWHKNWLLKSMIRQKLGVNWDVLNTIPFPSEEVAILTTISDARSVLVGS